MPSFAGQKLPARVAAAPAVAPAVAAAASTKLPKMSFLPLNLAQKAAEKALADCMRQGFPVTVAGAQAGIGAIAGSL